MNDQRGDQGRRRRFHGALYDYVRHHSFQANDRSNSIAGVEKPKSQFQYPGGNVGGPVLIPGTGFNKDRNKAVLLRRLRGAAAEGRPRLALRRRADDCCSARRSSRSS